MFTIGRQSESSYDSVSPCKKKSLIAYHQIKREGLLSAERFRVYDGVYRYGPGTSGEILAQLGRDNPRNATTKDRCSTYGTKGDRR